MEGVYIPQIHYNNHIAGRFTPFEGDLSNALCYLDIGQKKKTFREQLQKRHWDMIDYTDPQLFKLGKSFSDAIFENEIASYEEGIPNSGKWGDRVPLTKEEIKLGKNLVEHYKQAHKLLQFFS